MFDFEGDGYPEVVFADEVSVRIFNGLDGSVKMEATDHASETGFETPVVADIDGDGEVEIVLLHGSGPNGLTVYGDVDHGWQHGRAVWNQHAFSITNVEEDGSIPTVPPPNWATHNNFRSAAGGLSPGAYNDLSIEIVEVCTEECPDNLVLSVRVWNQGTEYVPSGLELIVQAGHGGPVVSRATIPDGIASGRSSVGIVFSLASSDLGGLSPVVGLNERVAPLSGFDDCAPENNHLEIPTSCD
jgi:hypothetical protein